MYGFAAYFRKEKTLLLARDPAGIKPLYICVDAAGEHLGFSSEIKGFFGIEWFEARPARDVEIQRQYLQYGYTFSVPVRVRVLRSEALLTLVPTLLEGVFQLCPGQKLILAPSGVVQSAISLSQEPTDPLAALESSVKQQSISDVEVGVQLSGGLDSSLVAYEYAKHNGAVHGFYVSIDDRKCSEDRWAHRAADLLCKRFRFQLHTIPATREEVARVMPSVAWFMDEPAVRHPNAAGVYLLCEYVRQRTPVRVLLTGEGADEMFGGYSWHNGRTIRDFDKPVRMFDLGGCALADARMAQHPDLPAGPAVVLRSRSVHASHPSAAGPHEHGARDRSPRAFSLQSLPGDAAARSPGKARVEETGGARLRALVRLPSQVRFSFSLEVVCGTGSGPRVHVLAERPAGCQQ